MKLEDMNNDIKTYLNESKFISNKCRNRVIKMLTDIFNIDIDPNEYKEYANVDITMEEDGSIILRNKKYNTKDTLTKEEVEERFNKFKEDAHNFMSTKDMSFDGKNKSNNILNLIMIVIIVIALVIVSIIAVKSIIAGDFYFALWFLVFIVPSFVPEIKENLKQRFEQAKNFIRRRKK